MRERHSIAAQRLVGVGVSPSAVRCFWQRHGFVVRYQRLLWLERQTAERSGVLTEAQMRLLRKARGAGGGSRAAHRSAASGLLAVPGHLLRGHHQGRGQDLPWNAANLRARLWLVHALQRKKFEVILLIEPRTLKILKWEIGPSSKRERIDRKLDVRDRKSVV